jgi:hypothetical protein
MGLPQWNPHTLGVHRVLKHFNGAVRPLINRRANERLKNAINIADLRQCAKKRMHPMW